MRDAAARHAMRSPDAFRPFAPAHCDQPLHRRFEEQAARRPDAVAVRLVTGDVSYAALNVAANRAARVLRAAIGEGDTPVALMLDQGYPAIVWTLAVLKAGRAYAPLDQRRPQGVLQAAVDDLAPAALVASARHRALAEAVAAGRVPVIEAAPAIPSAGAATVAEPGGDPRDPPGDSRDADPGLPLAADRPAYVFYTSGSTGPPKGVVDCHRNVLHNVLRYTNSLRLAPGDVLSLVQNPSFSGTVSTLFGALANGAAVAPFDLAREGLPALSPWLTRARVTVFHGVPSIFRQLSDPAERFPHVRLVRLEGDRATAADLRHFRANFGARCTLVNGLGTTECGLVRQFFADRRTRLDAGQPLPVGHAVPDVDVHVVDDHGRALPPDTIGEIVVESRFLALGYWRRPELTAQRFADGPDGRRRYRTGDLGRMGGDGCLTYLGRADHLVRIGGEFVDTDALERDLLGVAGVAQCVVGDYVDGSGERRLCAHLVAHGTPPVTVDRLRAALAGRDVHRIVPTAFVFLDALPLSPDLKVDRRRLPPPGRERPPLPGAFVPPGTALERRLARIWSEVLEIDPVGATDSFLDLGGDSLRAGQVVTRVRDELGHALPIATLFDHATIRALAAALAAPASA